MGKKKRKRKNKQYQKTILKNMLRQLLIDKVNKKHNITIDKIKKWDNDDNESYHNIERSINDIINCIEGEIDYIANAIERYMDNNMLLIPYEEQNINSSGDYKYDNVDYFFGMDLDRTPIENDICFGCKYKKVESKDDEFEGFDLDELYSYL